MQAIQQLKLMGALSPGGTMLPMDKNGTGKRLSPKEKAKLRNQREKDLRKRRRAQREGDSDEGREDGDADDFSAGSPVRR